MQWKRLKKYESELIHMNYNINKQDSKVQLQSIYTILIIILDFVKFNASIFIEFGQYL